MRKLAVLLTPAVAATAFTVAAAPAAAQGERPVTNFSTNAQIFPKKAGTPRRPRGIRIVGNLRFNTVTPGVEPPIVTGGTILLPKQGRYQGGRFPACPKRVLDRRGPAGCPRRSIMGQGSGVAFADNVDAKPDVVFVNGGRARLWAYTTLYNPALVREPIAINIRKVRHRRWGYRVNFNVPTVLQVVAGVPVTLRSFRFNVGGRRYARNYIVTTGCPRNNRYPYRAMARFLYSDGTRGQDTARNTVRCRR